METKARIVFLLIGLLFVTSPFSVARATPPQMGNPVLRIHRNQMAHALGDSSPKVIAADARVLLEGRSPKTTEYRKAANSSGLHSQLEEIAKALDAIARENLELKKRVHELELRLQAFERDNDQDNPNN